MNQIHESRAYPSNHSFAVNLDEDNISKYLQNFENFRIMWKSSFQFYLQVHFF